MFASIIVLQSQSISQIPVKLVSQMSDLLKRSAVCFYFVVVISIDTEYTCWIFTGDANNGKGLSSGFTSEVASKSVPDFKRCVLEQGIGQELRVISDSFYLEFSGFVSIALLLVASQPPITQRRALANATCALRRHPLPVTPV